MDGAAAALPPAGRKAKAKAPLPPPEPKNLEIPSLDEAELTNFTMEQKENIIDKDIELSVVLPGDVIKSTTVNGRKPMMDLLIFLCAQYHLNPSSYTIDLMSAENSQIKFKPNTPVGMLEVEKVILKPKLLDKKKPAPMIPEQTVRVVVNYKKTQKTVIRVSPHAPLQELTLIICSKCEFDPLHTVLLKNYQSQEPLDMTKSLNDLGLRELYAMDVSRALMSAFLRPCSTHAQSSQPAYHVTLACWSKLVLCCGQREAQGADLGRRCCSCYWILRASLVSAADSLELADPQCGGWD